MYGGISYKGVQVETIYSLKSTTQLVTGQENIQPGREGQVQLHIWKAKA